MGSWRWVIYGMMVDGQNPKLQENSSRLYIILARLPLSTFSAMALRAQNFLPDTLPQPLYHIIAFGHNYK